MSNKCNGGSVVDGDLSESLGEGIEQGFHSGDTDYQFPPDPVFHGYIKVPYVALTRTDITPYLNGSRKPFAPNSDRQLTKAKRKIHYEVHKERLSQECIVNVTRDDLTKLKAFFRRSRVLKRLDSLRSSCTDNEMASKCKICNKCYDSEKKLLNHQRKKHIIYINSKPMKHVSFSDHVVIHEVKEYHKCRKCPKIFASYHSLKLHTKQLHKKRTSYICNYCNKNFAERMIFKVHIKLHCDICGLLLPSKAKCIEHKRRVCKVIKLLPCQTCGLTFFNRMDLKDHSYDHGDACLVCDVCKDQFHEKCTIAHHIAFLHSKKRPKSLYSMLKVGNERLYLCNFCDQSSVERDSIERHSDKLPDLKNRVMTGYKDFYFCDVCMKKFATEQDMLHHKWTHFLKTTYNTTTEQPSILKTLLTSHLAGPVRTEASIEPCKVNGLESDIVQPVKTYNVHEILPLHFQPKVMLQRLDLEGSVEPPQFIDIEIDINPRVLKKAIVDPARKKTLLSRYKCQTCGKYFSNNYCLNRHISTLHGDFENLRCKVCEETFVWPSLLRTHKCILLHREEMPFDDARPEIHFDNLHSEYAFDDLNITDNDDYMNTIDFEIPAPIVELTEGETFMSNPRLNILQNKNNPIHSLGYKLVMQEVPIEF